MPSTLSTAITTNRMRTAWSGERPTRVLRFRPAGGSVGDELGVLVEHGEDGGGVPTGDAQHDLADPEILVVRELAGVGHRPERHDPQRRGVAPDRVARRSEVLQRGADAGAA